MSGSRFVGAIAIACMSAFGAGAADEVEVRAAVDRAWAEHIEAAQRKDIDALMEIYDADVVYVHPDLQAIRGIDAVREMEVQTLATATVVEATHSIRGLTVDGGIAYEVGSVTGEIRSGEARETLTYHFMAMWVRGDDGGWRIRYLLGHPEGKGD